jgi:type IV pilus assembly protein PilV
MIAMLCCAFGIVALVGLQANATSATTKSKFRIDAGLLASQCIAELWLLDRTNFSGATCATCSDANSDVLATALPGGSCSVVVNGDPRSDGGATAVVTVNWTAPGDSADAHSSHVAVAQISAN